jgi:hypothetical protein
VVEVGSLGSGVSRVAWKGGRCATFFDPTGHGGARDPKRTGEATQTAAFLVGVQNLLAASFWIGMGSRVLATLTSTGVTTIQLFPIGGMTIAYESVALTVRTVKTVGRGFKSLHHYLSTSI